MEDNIVKMLILLKLIYRFNAIPIKTSARISVDIDISNLELLWKNKGIRIAKMILRKKKKMDKSKIDGHI